MNIHIENQYVEFYEKRKMAVTTLDEFKKGLIEEVGIETPFFTDKCRYYKIKQNKEIVVLQFDKQIRTIKYRHEKHNPSCEIKEFKISIPSTVFIWVNDNCYIFWTNERLTNKNVMLWKVRFTNVFSDNKICFGDVGKDIKDWDILTKEKIAEDFFNSEFNNDLSEYSEDYKVWENNTLENEDYYQEFFNGNPAGSLDDILRRVE